MHDAMRSAAKFAIDEAGGSFGRGVRERRREEEEGAQTRGSLCVKREGRSARGDAQQAVGTKKPHSRQRVTRTRHKYGNWVARQTSKDYDYYYSEAGSAQALPLSLSHGHAAAANVHGGG